jgi:hypothetical protein
MLMVSRLDLLTWPLSRQVQETHAVRPQISLNLCFSVSILLTIFSDAQVHQNHLE